ncbi:DUF934 domain-containing protein [Mesorhizobium australicum]|uniref:Uncharacterized conserved protein, DUF934 family n=1 Tax=Mesorhizobium australicum TaxID=536018 RepID=A0A1X7MW16_9HYPH|nr:DUF934 domain-containing protein [Mesorhizobium australicum]SMH28897.1 Uncharacterized conserved protein, DUF934 family [Mesorhizobium australicum]
MTEPAPPPETRLWTPSGFRDDEWSHSEEFDAPGSNGKLILPLSAFLEIPADERLRDRDRIGVLLAPADPVEAIADVLDQVALVALSFPAFNDGRSFSKAELLRSRYGYAGPIRATGQVLVDQLPHMLRVGFDEFEVSHPVLIERLEKGETGGIGLYYQPTSTSSDTTSGYSWRRLRD